MDWYLAGWIALPLIAAGQRWISHYSLPTFDKRVANREAVLLMLALYGVELAVKILFQWSH